MSDYFEVLPSNSTVVAIDKDKNSQNAVKWAVDHLMNGENLLVLVHVKQKNQSGGDKNSNAHQVFIPYRGYCARKSIRVKEVVLDEIDAAKALVNYISSNLITNIVLGASSRSTLAKTFKKPDLPSTVSKTAPDFCNVYVISRSKVLSVRSATRPVANTATPPKLPSAPSSAPQLHAEYIHQDDFSSRGSLSKHEKPFAERNNDNSVRVAARMLRAYQGGSSKNLTTLSSESMDLTSGASSGRSSLSDDDIMDPFASLGSSLDIPNKNLDVSFVGGPRRDESNYPPSSLDVEAEMRRLRLELKQTMDMYSTACREAITAKQKAKELHERKIEEFRRVEQAKLSEESVLAIVEREKAKCRAAMEAAEAAQRLAEEEAKKRRTAEMKAKQEAEEKNRALAALSHNDVRYRKYTIEEVEAATDNFSERLKIGEGGYGPVYRGKLDHTPVAIKVLRPDAAQGRKQFQQEVEVLSCMRHPNMVLLLGACPEYGCLVYEYMNYGSLEDRLNRKGGTPPIPWRIRFKIAAEIATALTFLHQAKPDPLVHRDLKPANILLDRNFVSKISDVGLARLVPPSVVNAVTQYHMTCAAGTFCYIDPEYQQSGMLTTKSDVYSLGVMLLQIITARPPMGLTHHVQRAVDQGTLHELLDPTVPDWPVEEALAFARLALRCCELRKKDRPDLATVVLPELNRLRDLGMDEDGDLFFDHGSYQSMSGGSGGSRPRLSSTSSDDNGSQSSSSYSRSSVSSQDSWRISS